MSDATTEATGEMSSPRLAEFQAEVDKLKVTGGGANPERLGTQWGIGLTVFGFVVSFISWWSALNATKIENVHRAAIFATIGFAIVVTGLVVWIRNSMTRYLRYWIIRLVYEQREQTERIVEALREGK